ncbi:MAG: DoxX family protein [Acidimicrobiales bacterium]
MDGFDLGLLLLRVGAGITLAAHGYNKFFRGGRIPGTAGWFDDLGMRPGRLHAVLAASTEITSGLLLAAGLLTPFAGAGFVGVMTVAAWTVHRPNGFFIVNDGWEYTWILALIGVAVATLGPGRWSLDGALGIADDLDGFVGLAIAVGLGLAAAAAQLVIFWRPERTSAEAKV